MLTLPFLFVNIFIFDAHQSKDLKSVKNIALTLSSRNIGLQVIWRCYFSDISLCGYPAQFQPFSPTLAPSFVFPERAIIMARTSRQFKPKAYLLCRLVAFSIRLHNFSSLYIFLYHTQYQQEKVLHTQSFDIRF